MVNLEQSGIRTPDAWSAEISKIKEVPVLKGMFSETALVCVCTYVPNFKFQNKPLKSPSRLVLNDFKGTIFLVS